MALISRAFAANTDALKIASGTFDLRYYTWESEAETELALALNAASQLEDEGWLIGLECPITGVHRNYRVPVVAIQDSEILLIKPVNDPKKVNLSGLKMLDVRDSALESLTGFTVRAVVYAFFPSYDSRRRTSDGYEIWLRSSDVLPN